MKSSDGLTPVGLGNQVDSNIVARSPNVAVQGFCAWAKIGLGAHNALIRASADVVFNLGSLFHRGWKHWSQLQQPQNHESPGFGPICAAGRHSVGWIVLRLGAHPGRSCAQTSGCKGFWAWATADSHRPKECRGQGGGLSGPELRWAEQTWGRRVKWNDGFALGNANPRPYRGNREPAITRPCS